MAASRCDYFLNSFGMNCLSFLNQESEQKRGKRLLLKTYPLALSFFRNWRKPDFEHLAIRTVCAGKSLCTSMRRTGEEVFENVKINKYLWFEKDLFCKKNVAKLIHAFECQKGVENNIKIAPEWTPKGQCVGPRAKKEPRQGGLGAEVEPTVKPRRW